jgi:hypothetical protein
MARSAASAAAMAGWETFAARRRWCDCRGTHAASADTRASCASHASATPYSDEKVANREIRIWHFVIEHGY